MSPAYKFIKQAWDALPSGSWQRINSNMQGAISVAVGGGMKFEKGDFKRISSNFSGGHWLRAEGLYSSACGGERGEYNPSAAISIEDYFGREPWLWAEESKTPTRLHQGSRFTWKGHLVTVTSFDDSKQSLVAVTYKEGRDDLEYEEGGYRKVLSERIAKDGTVTKKWSAKIEGGSGTAKIAKRFTITHTELMEVRKAADDKVRKYVKAIAGATDEDALEAIKKRIVREGTSSFRHFDVETLRTAYGEKSTAFKKAIQEIKDAARRKVEEKKWRERAAQLAKTHDADIKRWMDGEDLDRSFDVVRLRIKEGFVETSTQQRATVPGVRRAILFVNKYREVGWTQNGETQRLDQFPIKRVDKEGVLVGCTFVEWSEVDRITEQLAGVGQ